MYLIGSLIEQWGEDLADVAGEDVGDLLVEVFKQDAY